MAAWQGFWFTFWVFGVILISQHAKDCQELTAANEANTEACKTERLPLGWEKEIVGGRVVYCYRIDNVGNPIDVRCILGERGYGETMRNRNPYSNHKWFDSCYKNPDVVQE